MNLAMLLAVVLATSARAESDTELGAVPSSD
jgi:hypothetical protein